MKQGSYISVLLGLFCSVAAAQSSLVSTPYQLAISAGGVLPEDLRGLNPGAVSRVSLGIPLRPGAYLDASFFGLRAAGENSGGSETSLGGGLDLRLERLDERINYLFLFGGGYSRTQRNSNDINAPYINAGWGISYELSPSLALRSEIRGMARFDKSFIPGRGVTYDALATLGLVFNLGQSPRSERRPESRAAPTIDSVALPPPVLPPPAPTPPRVVHRVYSATDPCPAAPAGAAVDADGCLGDQRLVLPRSDFFSSVASTELLSAGDAALAALAVSLLKRPELFAEINVHTSSEGYADDNLKASAAQAAAIETRLYQMGAVEGQITASGIGEERPRANEISEAAAASNRRIDIRLVRR